MGYPWKPVEARPDRPDLSLGELRLAAEAALVSMRGDPVPQHIRARMVRTFEVLAGVQ